MKNWVKLALPLGLGIVAGGMNYAIMYRAINPKEFVVAKADLNVGDELDATNLVKKVVSGEAAALLKAAIPWEGHASLVYGRRLTRPLDKDDLLLWRDVNTPDELILDPTEDALAISVDGVAVVERFLPVGDKITFVVASGASDLRSSSKKTAPDADRFERVGPFRLLSVGQRMTKFSADDQGAGSDHRVITIAIPKTDEGLNDRARRLLNSLAQDQRGRSPLIAMIIHGNEPSALDESQIKTNPATAETTE